MITDESSPIQSWIWHIKFARSKNWHKISENTYYFYINSWLNYIQCFLLSIGSIFIFPEVRGQAVTQAGYKI